ncbi:hypothetical protein B0T24DRAFT_598187 [Lasiosphaeria ovina]|uniref:Uncharacterized protein n=1 Tax=Lasiosphaeria ovina TaxID=92902 RepID=A0AAE0MZR3_9PEZI|nr:hypothetical protein B0T24DRAFT_598187 [Lasiosphaeria ovina]
MAKPAEERLTDARDLVAKYAESDWTAAERESVAQALHRNDPLLKEPRNHEVWQMSKKTIERCADIVAEYGNWHEAEKNGIVVEWPSIAQIRDSYHTALNKAKLQPMLRGDGNRFYDEVWEGLSAQLDPQTAVTATAATPSVPTTPAKRNRDTLGFERLWERLKKLKAMEKEGEKGGISVTRINVRNEHEESHPLHCDRH